jgi:hypothetical protein
MGVKLVSASAGSVEIVAPATASNFTATMPDGSGTVVINGVNSAIVSGTAVASTSGTSIDFTGIPSWVKRITVMFNGVSANGGDPVQVQIGDSGGVETSGYSGAVLTVISNSAYLAEVLPGAGFRFETATGSITAAATRSGHLILTNVSGLIWVASGNLGNSGNTVFSSVAGTKTLSGTLDRVRITTVNGADTFDAGSINILYE